MSDATSANQAAEQTGLESSWSTLVPSRGGNAARAWRRFKRNRVAAVALAVLIVIVVFSLSAGFISSYVTGFDYEENHLDLARSQPGENGFILGSDANGRDVLTRLAYGGRVSLVFATMAALATLVIGSIVGMVSGFALGWTDSALMRSADVLLSIPAISILVLVSSIYRPGYFTLALVFSLLLWPGIARIVRGETIAIRSQPYIDAARVNGASNKRLVARHVLPNVLPIMLIWASQVIPAFIITEAALSFLGLGVQPPRPSWGNMLLEAQNYYMTNWTNVFLPGLMIFLTALSINLIGNGLRDALDPRMER
ncbi:MAG: ABC transporter permease [Thermomicrobiales bacterium]|nr:MAG: ABC transporter permease [Thermomicrobiales bacterium]